MKIMSHVLHNSKADTSKETEQSIFLQSSFTRMSFKNNGEINIQQIRSSDNPADLFTKALPATTFKKFLRQIGMRRLKDLHTEILRHQGER